MCVTVYKGILDGDDRRVRCPVDWFEFRVVLTPSLRDKEVLAGGGVVHDRFWFFLLTHTLGLLRSILFYSNRSTLLKRYYVPTCTTVSVTFHQDCRRILCRIIECLFLAVLTTLSFIFCFFWVSSCIRSLMYDVFPSLG